MFSAFQSFIIHYQRTMLELQYVIITNKPSANKYIAPKHMKSLTLTQRSEGGKLF